MARLRCPRCSTIVEVADGAAPACTNCGFGTPSGAPSAAPAVAPAAAPLAPPASMAPAAAPVPRRRTGMVVAIAVVSILVVGLLAFAGWRFFGAGGDAAPLTDEEAQTRLVGALGAVSGAFSGDPESDELRKIEMSIEGDPAAGDDMFGLGGGGFEIAFEWGQGDVMRIDLASSGGAFTFAVTLYCSPEGTVMVMGADAYGSRPSASGGGACEDLDSEEADFSSEEILPVPVEDLDAEGADVDVHKDGSITAVIEDEEAVVTVEVDEDGRLTSLVVEGVGEEEGMEATMSFDYGPRRTLAIPEPTALIPATMVFDEEFDAATHTLTIAIVDSPEKPLRSEMEAQITDGFGGEVVTSFPLNQASATQAGVSYAYVDADGDGRVSAGDSLSLSHESWESQFDVDAIIYDTLADGEVNSSPMGAPGPALGWVALGVVGLALLLRRRQA